MQVRPISTSGECAPHDDARRRRAGRRQRLAAAGLTLAACCLAGVAGPPVAGAHGHGGPPRGQLLSGYGGGGGGTPRHRGSFRHRGHHAPPPQAEGIQTIATGLNQPKKLTVAPDGSLLVALSGDGTPSTNCVGSGEEQACLNQSGAIDRITASGQVSTALGGLPSVSAGGGATGPAEARYVHGALEVLFQDELSPTTHEQPFGPEGALLGDLLRVRTDGSQKIQASFGPFEAENNPDKGAGSAVELGAEPPIDSDPYSFVPYHGGFVVADAAGNDLLFVSRSGAVKVLAVFPPIPETFPPGTLGPSQTEAIKGTAQAVPDSVAVGPDGALYVGELGGAPFEPGTSDVYRVVPHHAPTVYASGFTAIGDIGFDWSGRLLVLEIDQQGLNDAFTAPGLPSPGAIIGVHGDGSRQVLASTGLEFPTGLAVGPRGSLYVSNYGVLSATGGPEGLSGQVDRVGVPASWLDSWR
jgi:hypothetical protein